jgi:hypothetical protein
MKDSVHQGSGWSTPKHITRPGGLASLRNAIQGRTGLYSVMGWDDTYQEVVYPLLLATAHRLVQVAA